VKILLAVKPTHNEKLTDSSPDLLRP